MNEVIRGLIERKSMRVYTEQEISPADKALILKAAAEAPTAGNQQLYTILDITDQKIKDRLVETCDHQGMIAEAKMVLIFCADCKKWYDAYLATGCAPRKPAIGDLMLAVSDTMIAAQNAVTAAESLGIGSCYIGDVMENCAEQRALLNLPEFVFPVGMLIFGYPTQQQKDRPKPARVEQKFIVHENGYRCLSDEDLEEMWTPRCGVKSYTEWMQAFCKRKYNSEFSREMSRSVAEYLRQYEET
ncbi:MAG: nitroreductase family protein [Oscillospiraceae bacterium]|nr:nitroreductase family protein [Oscillospiraceae bacterium]